jgi:predicted nucleic acid-binding protein
MAVTVYWLDTNVFIQAKNGPYNFKVFGVFWAFLHEQITAGTIRCPKMVYQEIVTNEDSLDDLAKWIKSRRQSGLVVDADRDVQKAMTMVSDHVLKNYAQHHAAQFLSGADPWLIAHALHTNGVVVTHESTRHPNAKTVRIPDVCAAIGVPCMDTYKMLEKLGADFRPTGHKRAQ